VIERARGRGWDKAGELLRDAIREVSHSSDASVDIFAYDDAGAVGMWEHLVELAGAEPVYDQAAKVAIWPSGGRIHIGVVP
jgi:hypothetical protein